SIKMIQEYDHAIYKRKEDLQFLSGKGKKEAEKDITDYKEQRDKMLDFAADKIKNAPGSAELLKLIKPEDAGIIADWKKYRGPHVDLRFFQNRVWDAWEKNMQVDDISRRKEQFIEYLQNDLNIDAYLTHRIIGKLWSEKEREAGFYGEKEQETAEKKEKAETLNLPYKYFDASEELEKINKFTEAELKNLTPNERLELKKEKLKNLKKELAEQMVGISKINAEMETMALDSDVIDRKKLDNYLSEKAEVYRLNPVQLEKYRYVLDKIGERNRTINEVAGKFAGKTDGEIFFEMFGQKPAGEVEIKKGALSFFVICKNIKDYSRLYAGNDKPEDVEIARNTGGFAGGGRTVMRGLEGYTTTVANAAITSDKSWLESVKIHEEKHILETMTRKVEIAGEYEKFTGSEKIEIQKKELCEMINQDKIRNERRAKNEVFAYIKDGTPVKSDAPFREDIKKILLRKKAEGGLYDYFEFDKKFYSHPDYAKFGKELLNDVYVEFRNKYEQDITKALETADRLEKLGFPKDRIIGLFQAERLDQWDKTYIRFKTSEEFQDKKEEIIKTLDESIKNFGNTVDYYKRRLKKERDKEFILRTIDSITLKLRNKFADTKKLSEEEILEGDVKRVQQHYEELLNRKKEYEKL
ncbi:MAG: hypothetical protein Q8N42_01530, partial [bacterium]|nr:hypothetical protein [bacterium]